MNVGLYFDMRNPPQWQTDWSRLYGFTLEMCEEAERLGAHSIWVSEHHLFDDGYLPQTLTMAAAIAARTKRVRIGTAILIAPLHHGKNSGMSPGTDNGNRAGRFSLNAATPSRASASCPSVRSASDSRRLAVIGWGEPSWRHNI